MKRTLTIISYFFFLISPVFSQAAFLSRLFFPVTFGLTFPLEDSDKNGRFITSEGMEYRFNTKVPLFTRISLDNLSVNYSINPTSITNAIKSSYDANVVTLGAGVRTITGRLGFSGLLQAGDMNYRYPYVINLDKGYEVRYSRRNQLTFGVLGSVEYYFVKDFAVVLEGHYMYSPNSGVFWGKDFHYASIRIGITAVLF